MDSMHAAAAAARLGTSVPRVMRAAERLGMRTAPGRLSLTRSQYEALRDELGVTPRVAGLTPTEAKVLAALRRAPLGLVSARAVASRAGTSPTAASKALGRLQERDLVYREDSVLARGRARPARLWRANALHPDWSDIAASLDRVRPPRPRDASRVGPEERVPPRLRHLFWNTAPAQLDVRRSGPSIARRLLREQDPEGLAWGAVNLRPSDWVEAARARGLDPPARRMAENLADYARR